MRSFLFVAASLAIPLCIFADSGRAEDAKDTCAYYGTVRVVRSLEALTLGCDKIDPQRFNPSDPEWSTDNNVHMNFCNSANEQSVDDANLKQEHDLNYCKTYIYCQQYAKQAVEAEATNVRRHCGFSGDRWSGDSAQHFNWCMSQKQIGDHYNPNIASPLVAENRARDAQLAVCEANYHPKLGHVKRKLGHVKRKIIGHAKDPTYDIGSEGSQGSQQPCGGKGQPPCPGTGDGSPSSPKGGAAARVIGPGLLEGDSGFSSQGPAAAGTVQAPRRPTYSRH
jgi:hypothetical protein